MSLQKTAPIPPPSPRRFENGIAHPDLWLWDSWTTELDGTAHLYCLALSRLDSDGQATRPDDRNAYPFHIRHFISTDAGQTWKDEGAFLSPQNIGDGAFARNVWSGGILARSGEAWLCGFTGIRHQGDDKPFLQTICIGRSQHGSQLDEPPKAALLCPLRDHDLIRAAGYYLPARDMLGAAEGEEGGPILAWRDPFIVEAADGALEVFWSAKISPTRSAVAHATVRQEGGVFEIEALNPPITLPDDHSFTQAEVPKLHFDLKHGKWLLLISACDRLDEAQPADEVTKVLRLYKSDSLRGPWTGAFRGGSSLISGADFLFGASILHADVGAGQVSLIAPYTEYAPEHRQLTFAPPIIIELPRENAESLTGMRHKSS